MLGHLHRGSGLAIGASIVGRALPSIVLIAAFLTVLGLGFENNMVALAVLGTGPVLSRRSRVTPGSLSTRASLLPTSRLNRVDLPTFGRPTIATLLMGFSLRLLPGAVGGDEAEPALGEPALGRRDSRIAEHEVELLAGLVVFAALEIASARERSAER